MNVADRDGAVVVTGAAGFIGGRVAGRYAAAGRPVVAIDRPGRSFSHLPEGVRLVEADVTDADALGRGLSGIRPGTVIHCAAMMGGWGDAREYVRVNAGGTRAVAAWAAAAGARRLVYISSVSVYGMPPIQGIDEDTPFRHIGLPYGDSKMEAEKVVREAHAAGLPATILRPGDVYGPRAGEWVVKLVEAMRAGRMILIGGGRGLINTTHVDNLADAIETVEATTAAAGRDYIITDGAPVTWKTYLAALSRAADVPTPRVSLPVAAAWPLVLAFETAGRLTGRRPPLSRMGLRLLTARCSYSIERARCELGWEPRVDLARGMQGVAGWLRTAVPTSGGPRPVS